MLTPNTLLVETGSPTQQRIAGSEEGVSNAAQLASITDSRDVSGGSTVVQPEASTTYQQQ